MAISSSVQDSIKPLIKPLLAGGLMFSLITILLDINGAKSLFNNPALFANFSVQKSSMESLAKSCEGTINKTAQLSREQLLQLLAVPERSSASKARQILKEPYCQLSTLQVRAGAASQREAYPLAFDPTTALVILYENDEYAGYRFKY